MNTLLENSTLKPEFAIFLDVLKCQKCSTSENLCEFHAESVKDIMLKDTQTDIKKLTTVN